MTMTSARSRPIRWLVPWRRPRPTVAGKAQRLAEPEAVELTLLETLLLVRELVAQQIKGRV